MRHCDAASSGLSWWYVSGSIAFVLYQFIKRFVSRVRIGKLQEMPSRSAWTQIQKSSRWAALGVLYTGNMGGPVSVSKGWLRVSMHKASTSHPFHRYYLPYRDYTRAGMQPVRENEKTWKCGRTTLCLRPMRLWFWRLQVMTPRALARSPTST